MKYLKLYEVHKFNESFNKDDYYRSISTTEADKEWGRWNQDKNVYKPHEVEWFKKNGWDDYNLRVGKLTRACDWTRLNPRTNSDGEWVFKRDYYICVYKTEDDYFIVGHGHRAVTPADFYYKCDQWEGFLELIKDITK